MSKKRNHRNSLLNVARGVISGFVGFNDEAVLAQLAVAFGNPL